LFLLLKMKEEDERSWKWNGSGGEPNIERRHKFYRGGEPKVTSNLKNNRIIMAVVDRKKKHQPCKKPASKGKREVPLKRQLFRFKWVPRIQARKP